MLHWSVDGGAYMMTMRELSLKGEAFTTVLFLMSIVLSDLAAMLVPLALAYKCFGGEL